jgi:hypothetical protein
MKSLCLILILAISATTGCSNSHSASRQERAYAKYVKKSKIDREKRQAAFRKEKAKIPEPGTETFPQQEMTQASQASEGPQAIPSEPSS